MAAPATRAVEVPFPSFVHMRGKPESGTIFATFQVQKLSKDEVHFFVFGTHTKEFLVVTALEYLVFHPSNSVMNDKFQLHIMHLGKHLVMHVHVPIEFKETCEKIAKLFDLVRMTETGVFGVISRGLHVLVPSADNVLQFKPVSGSSSPKAELTLEDIRWIGDRLSTVD